jgi:hypothetical protein
MGFWANLWDFIGLFFSIFIFVAYLWALILIVSDLFRDRKLNGWWKALWILLLLVVPFITALVYIIARGNGMAERAQREAKEYQQNADEYIKKVAGTTAADEIAKAKALLDSGAISQADYDSLKAKALA